MRKKAITTALIFALVLSCTACGGKKTDDTQQGTLSEVTQTPTEAPEDAYVPPKPNEEKTDTEEDESTSDESDSIIDNQIAIDMSNPAYYNALGLYEFNLPSTQFTTMPNGFVDSEGSYQEYQNLRTGETIALYSFMNSVEGVKQMVEEEAKGKTVDNWQTYEGQYVTWQHFVVYPENSLEYHYFVHERKDGLIGLAIVSVVIPEEWQYFAGTARESDASYVPYTPTETDTTDTQADTGETSTETEQPSEGDTETQTESSTEAGSTEE